MCITPKKHLRLVGSTAEPDRRVSWERSFPQGTVEGVTWILDVLDDLAAFSECRDLPEVLHQLVAARQTIAAQLQNVGQS